MTGEEPRQRVVQKDYSNTPALDYNFLRKKGIELIQQFSGDNWTDFNIHDPGVTILEALCFAITDLAYRTGFPITDLLADENGIINKESHSFIPRDRILSSAPVSVTDFRKMIIDAVPQVTNIWLEPLLSSFSTRHVKGLYRVVIQIESWLQHREDGNEEKQKAAEDEVIEKVKAILADSRNINEDFVEFVVLQPQKIQVSAQLVISRNAIPEELLAQVYFRIEQVLNPRTLFFAEQELLAKGIAVEDIYQGPLLSHGIIPDSELKEIQKEIDKPDIISAISDMTDVVHIRNLQVKNAEDTEYTNKPVMIQEHHYPVLYFEPASPGISLYYGSLPVPVKTPVFYSMLQRLHDTYHKEFIADVHKANTQRKAEGIYRDVQDYTSIQNFFPALYRIGYDGIENSASPKRKAEAKQLKAYLLFFEQILASYASQLANMEALFSPRIDAANEQTYFFQPLYQVPHIAPLLKAFTDSDGTSWQAFTGDKQNAYITGLQELTEPDETYRGRKKQAFNHLLSRFNIIPDDYPVILFRQLYKPDEEDKRADEELVWKSALLSQAQPFTYYRMKAENYHSDDKKNQFGFAFNMRLLLYIQSSGKKLTDAVSAYISRPEKSEPHRHDKEPKGTYTIHYNEEEITIANRNTDDDIKTAFHFPHRAVKFFEWGISRSNYRVVPVADTEEQQVIYKNPQEPFWNIVRQYPDRQTAQTGIHEWITALTDASIQSEGFYIVEHLLLAPPTNTGVFGFTFYGRNGQPLLHQAQRTSFRQREETIETIINIITAMNEDHPTDNLQKISGLCTVAIPGSHSPVQFAEPSALQSCTEEELSQLWMRLQNDMLFFKTRHTEYYPAFQYSVLHWDGSVMDETFYDNQVTIVFPSWPVRFQYDGFRRFSEALFRSQLPVHQKVNFLWLNITRMLRFETMFFNWKEALSSDNPNAKRMIEILFVPLLQHEINRGGR